MQQCGYDVEILNAIYSLHKSALKNKETTVTNANAEPECEPPVLPNTSETLSCVLEARANWAQFLQEQILSISHQLGKPLIVIRPFTQLISNSDNYRS
jgi:hypothetical protein